MAPRKRKSSDAQMVKKKKTKPITYKVVPRFYAPICPPKMRVRLVYGEQFTLDPGASGVPAQQVWRANDCYDPDFTGAGHQPRGFDQWMALYGTGQVIKSTITINLASAAAQTEPYHVALFTDTESTARNQQDVMENHKTVTKLIPQGASGEGAIVLKENYMWKQYYDVTTASLKFTSSASPGNVVFYSLWAAPIATTSNLASLAGTVRIEYDVIFEDPILPSGS